MSSDETRLDPRHYSYEIYRRADYAGRFDEDRFGGPAGRMFHDIHLGKLWELLPEVHGVRILEVGAGTGRFAVPLAVRGARVTATDASAAMLAVARDKAHARGVSLDLQVADAHHLPFRDRSFDVVLSSRMLMHVIDWRQVLAEMCRVASLCVIADYPPRCSFAGSTPLLLPLVKRRKPETQVYRVFSPRCVRRELERHGFAETAWNKQFVLPFFVHRRWRDPARSLRWERLLAALGLQRAFGAPRMFRADRLAEAPRR
jgi:SAM-dependent methyltransferase